MFKLQTKYFFIAFLLFLLFSLVFLKYTDAIHNPFDDIPTLTGSIQINLEPHVSFINSGSTVNLSLNADAVYDDGDGDFDDNMYCEVRIPGTTGANGRIYQSPERFFDGAPFRAEFDPYQTYGHVSRAFDTPAITNNTIYRAMCNPLTYEGSNPVPVAAHDITITIVHTLAVTKSGTGSGTVTSAPAGISCGADCSEAYTSGTSVTLTATPAASSTFTGWSGADCSGTETCAVTMDAAKTVNAKFNPPPSSSSSPSVSFFSSPSTIKQGQKSTLSWFSQNVQSCAASDGWSGAKPLSGSETVSPTKTTDYTLICFGTVGQVLKTATVTVKIIPGVIEF